MTVGKREGGGVDDSGKGGGRVQRRVIYDVETRT